MKSGSTFGILIIALGIFIFGGCTSPSSDPFSEIVNGEKIVGISKLEAISAFSPFHRNYRCEGCHGGVVEVIDKWAVDSDETFEKLKLAESNAHDQSINSTFRTDVLDNKEKFPTIIKGIYRANPFYFRRHFSSEESYKVWESLSQDQFSSPIQMDFRSNRRADATQRTTDFAKMINILRSYAVTMRGGDSSPDGDAD